MSLEYSYLADHSGGSSTILESFGIMDFSLLLGVHNIDEALRDRVSCGTLKTCM